MQVMFHAMAQLESDEATIERALERMCRAGACLDPATGGEQQP